MHTFWPWVNGGTHFNKAPTPWRALPYAWSLDLTFLLLNWLLDQQTVTCIKITVHPMESSRACRDISEGELSFVRRPWIFGVWHNNSGWSHAQEILKLYKLSRREREVLGSHWPLPSRPHPSASSSPCSPQGPTSPCQVPKTTTAQSQRNPNDWVCMAPWGWQGLSTKAPTAQQGRFRRLYQDWGTGPREAPHITQLVEGEIA